ncbi:MAG: DUF3473 domain-containing protein [Candidatus Scalindua rubra]|uniref:DUF3473 domain-containing protein n=1 Tax=Candidatus Scalindua brodae TaxID=237368 RepID=A0A0B0EKC5_9BACT|nr:MAG: hypothetical protein SCABRO_02687 [Candidatus Scalindua brodae]MBZ0109699.1 DUF3473 domain-containing protein [Candidatus Scalindua rubra]TWU32430.1 hypothetical protein S225a_18230 [Candidatus Brocadiaceae bacterium S225]
MGANKVMITIDLEDWFQVENFKNCIPFSRWSDMEQRFEYSTRNLLKIFDEKSIKATFFILGWNAEQAPGFSITEQAIMHLKEIGFTYDSSYNNFGFNHRHGKIDLTQYNKKLLAYRDSEGFWELPISNLSIGKIIFPWWGGGYFRLLNKTLFRCGVKRIMSKESGYMFYAHPWEIDPEQPRVKEAGLFFRFRHYLNLRKFKDRLYSFIESFQDCSFVTCSQYINFLENK